MSVNAAFTPTGNSFVLTASTSAPTPIQVVTNGANSNQYRIINSSTTQGAFLSYSQNSSTAQSNCVIPTAGNSTTTLYILPNTDEIITFVPAAYFTAITSSNSATLYITPGDGL